MLNRSELGYGFPIENPWILSIYNLINGRRRFGPAVSIQVMGLYKRPMILYPFLAHI